MIYDNTNDTSNEDNFTHPLHLYLNDYSLIGNIISEINKNSVRFIIDLPNVSLDAGILFKMIFLEKIKDYLNTHSQYNYYVDIDYIKCNYLLKENEQSLIVKPEIINICEAYDISYTSNRTYRFNVVLSQFMKVDFTHYIAQYIEEIFDSLTKQFRHSIVTFNK